ncbi:hypothetical protein JDV02_002475 [Purpureocillium takamizusanense]|uniref:DUF427 domain-containing protein n=1 Tax=Purpureocillium takamizusanense TaxID=2060973 RepID=A0A9Q8V7G7_9HYPO|nr:uncharacterized protein JDV02_002475 [Purpureocillium takamizusanense]UNI15995.1 hypothetical protein JDV02_002475 [Purpureocillium takamizusanense]
MLRPGAHGTDLAELAGYLLQNGPRKVHHTSRRVRVVLAHRTIVDTTAAVHVWEHDGYPHYYVPHGELTARGCTLRDKSLVRSDSVTRAAVVELVVPARDGLREFRTDRVLRFTEDRSLGALAGLVRLEFGSMDQWLEEDAVIYVHPKDPFKRIDVLPSSRPVEIKVGGKTVAKAPNSVHLLETGLPTRYYLSAGAVDQSSLRKSDLVTRCPYKGDAEYYHVVVDGTQHDDLVWYYRLPTHESAGIAGLLCFYNEKVDVYLDGKLQEKPKSPFS